MKSKWLLLVLFLASSCAAPPEDPSLLIFQDTVMTVPYKIQVACACKQKDRSAIEHMIASTFKEIDTIYNKWNASSELSAVNRHASTAPLLLSRELYRFLELADTYVKLTEGRFDPTIEPVQQIWKAAFKAQKMPLEKEIALAAPHVGWDKLTLKNGYLQKESGGVQLDLGGIAKGLAVDMLVKRLNASGYADVYVEWGGEIRTSGRHPDNRPWRVYISRLGDCDPSQAVEHLDLEDSAIATSGDYLQQWEIGGQTYFHIINPRTLHPLLATHTSIASVTVMARTCLEADVLATAAMLFPSVESARTWAEQHPTARFWVMSRQSLSNEL